jgi:hypothetical protein
MDVIRWLLDSDPSIRWQVMRDLTGAPADDVAAERAKVAREGAGRRLLALQAPDGRWGGAAWNRGWDSRAAVLSFHRGSPGAGAAGLVFHYAGFPGNSPRQSFISATVSAPFG